MLGISLTGDSRTEVVTTISGNLAKIFSLVYDVSGFQPVGKYFKVVCPLSPNPTLLQKKKSYFRMHIKLVYNVWREISIYCADFEQKNLFLGGSPFCRLKIAFIIDAFPKETDKKKLSLHSYRTLPLRGGGGWWVDIPQLKVISFFFPFKLIHFISFLFQKHICIHLFC